jgi:hypothetical protein
MSDHAERACRACGALTHHEDDCARVAPQQEPVTEAQLDAIDRMGSPLLRALVREVRLVRQWQANIEREIGAELRDAARLGRREALEEALDAVANEGDDCGSEHDEAVRACKRAIRELIAKLGEATP